MPRYSFLAKFLRHPAVIVGGGLYSVTNNAVLLTGRSRMHDENAQVQKPPGKLSIIAPGYREPKESLARSLESLQDQNVLRAYPESYEIIYAGTKGDPLYDQKLISNYADKIVLAPRGKLFARAMATDEASGDIIVSIDLDVEYPRNFLNLMLEPYHKDPEVIATTSTSDLGLREYLMYIPSMSSYYGKILLGRGSTYFRQVFYDSGGFNLNIDQSDVPTLWKEEELDFRKRMEQFGKVALVNAPIRQIWGHPEWRGIRSKREAFHRGKLASSLDTELEASYGSLKVEGLSVVDIGADTGSSVNYFLQRGAGQVLAYESDPELSSLLAQNFAGDSRVETHGAWNGEWVEGDILKADCESCEQLLQTNYIASFRQFAIALHPQWISPMKYQELRDFMLQQGASLVYATPDGQEEMFVKSL